MVPQSVFISFAHKTSYDFVNHLAYDLRLYLGKENVFWDQAIVSGLFEPQLFAQIERAEFFLFVMSGAASVSKWCQDELTHARTLSRTIIPIREFDYADQSLSGIDYSDFYTNFDMGFR